MSKWDLKNLVLFNQLELLGRLSLELMFKLKYTFEDVLEIQSDLKYINILQSIKYI
jgi:hypothetical protein